MPATSLASATPVKHDDRAADRLLQRMVVREIVRLGVTALDAIREHRAVLARAVVLQRRIGRRRRHFAPRLVEPGRVRAALQVGRRAACTREHVRHRLDVARLAGMTGAHQRDLCGRIAESLHAAARGKRQRLQRLQRAARKRQRVRIAGRVQHATLPIDDRHGARMDALDDAAARDFGQGCVGGGQRRLRARGRSRANPHYRLSGVPGLPPAVRARRQRMTGVQLRTGASATRICSSAAGSSIVVRSPGSRASASAWIERRSSLPERVFGSSVTK